MVVGMATTKITITLPDSQLAEIRKRVAAHESGTISGFIQQAVQKSLENADEFLAMIEKGLMETGGLPTAKERAWARRVLTPRRTERKRRNTA
jgi:Arc/MetJ-type ribon-helix-helix transcriptional regulator